MYESKNSSDVNGDPAGGYFRSKGLDIRWQDGPRGLEQPGVLEEPNGAFIEDVIYAALQRLEFFETSRFKCVQNEEAIKCLRGALDHLAKRRLDRAERGVEGKNIV